MFGPAPATGGCDSPEIRDPDGVGRAGAAPAVRDGTETRNDPEIISILT